MAMDREPNIVRSGLSGRVNQDGITLEVEIYRLEDDPRWALEVVDHTGASTVWEDLFETDVAALLAFQQTVKKEGVQAFLEQKVIPFPGKR